MNYVVSILIIAFLGIMIFTNTRAIIEKIKAKKKEKANSSEVIENNKEVEK